MSSGVNETSSQLSSQSARPKPGQGQQSSGNDGFSGLVDENLAATTNADANPAERPRKPAREANPESQQTRRTGIHSKPRNQTESMRQPSSEPAARDTGTAEVTTVEALDAEAAAEIVVRTGVVTAEVASDLVETTAQTDTEETAVPAATPAPAVSGAFMVATAVTVQIELAAEAPASVIERGDAITITNPAATIVASPAETAANALARVASDTGDIPATAVAETATPAETEATVATSPLATDAAAAAETDAVATAPVLEADAAAETALRVETAKAEAQLDAKADTELSAAAKVADAAKPTEAPKPDQLLASTESKPARTRDEVRATPEQAPAKPDAREDRRAEPRAAAETAPNRPIETEARPAPRATQDHTPTPPAHAQAAGLEQQPPQPTGFGLSQTASLHMSNAVQAAQLTAMPVVANVPVPIGGLAVEIAANAQIGRSRFEIRLDPPELGRIDVRLDVDRQGQVTSHLIVEKSATLDLLRRDASQLERALQDAGLKTSDNGLQFSLRDQQQQGRNDDNGTGRNAQRLVVTEEETIPVETAGRSYGRMIGQRGGIDIRV